MSKTMDTVNVNDISRISNGTFIKGEIVSEGDIRIDGRVEGSIRADGKVVVGEKAVISGDIICTNLDFWGTMHGDVYVKEVLSLKSTSDITGNLHIRKFEVEMGARINGYCKMITEDDFAQVADGTASAGQE